MGVLAERVALLDFQIDRNDAVVPASNEEASLVGFQREHIHGLLNRVHRVRGLSQVPYKHATLSSGE